jgi:hypothetical protein
VAAAALLAAALLVITVARAIEECYGGLPAFLTAGLIPSVFFWSFFTSPSHSSLSSVLHDTLRSLAPLIVLTVLLLTQGIAMMGIGSAAGRGSRFACILALLIVAPYGPVHLLLLTLSLAWLLYARYEPVGFSSTTAVVLTGSFLLLLSVVCLLHWRRLMRDLFRLRRLLGTR